VFFSQSKQPVGLDIGSTSLKIVELKKTKQKQYELAHLGTEDISPDVIVDGAVMDSSVVVNAIQSIFENSRVKNSNVALSISGNAVIIKKIFLPKMSEEEIGESIKWEAEQYIPFDIDDVSIDFQVSKTQGGESKQDNTEVILVAAKREKINDYVSVINIAGKKPVIVDVDAFAIQNAYEHNYGIDEGKLVSLVNVGASVMNINILDCGHSVFWRDISIGGNQYNEQIQKSFNVSRESAENLKKGIATENISMDDLMPIINSVSNSIAIEIQKTIDFYQTASSKTGLDKIILAGGCANITGFAKFLEERFHTEVEIMNPLKNIHVDEKAFDPSFISEISPSLAVSVGLALREM
jgi:type IV pilus assembly protein PilM